MQHSATFSSGPSMRLFQTPIYLPVYTLGESEFREIGVAVLWGMVQLRRGRFVGQVGSPWIVFL